MTNENITYIDTYIGEGTSASISLHNIFDSILVGDGNNPNHIYRVPINDFFLTHRDELRSIETIKRLPETLYYKPKYVSMSLYGTTELWLSLLRVNRMRDTSEFCKPIIKVYEPNQLIELLKIYFKREDKM